MPSSNEPKYFRHLTGRIREDVNKSMNNVVEKLRQMSDRHTALRKRKKIGPQCVLGVLCLVLFHSVGMLFSNISIWELNCYKGEGRQGKNAWQNTVYFIFISNKGLLLKALV